MHALSKILFWLAFLFAGFLPAAALTPSAPQNCVWEIFSIGYDAAIAEVTNLESRTEASTWNYDSVPIYSLANEEIPTGANRALFGQNAEFKAAEGAGSDLVTLYHGTTSNAASKIVSGGLRDADTFFAEEMNTSQYFASEAAARTGASSTSTISFTMPRSVANDLGLLDRQVIGTARNLPTLDIDGGSGFERILPSENVSTFNSLMEDGTITTRRLKH